MNKPRLALPAIGFKQAVGIRIDEGEVCVALVAQTLRGAQLQKACRFSLPEATGPGGGPKRRVLVVDDNLVDREVVSRLFLKRDFEVLTAVDGQDALDQLKAGPVDLIVTDLMMPRLDGMGLLKELEHISPRPPAIVTSAYGKMDAEISTAVEVARRGAFGYMGKPIRSGPLFEMVDKCLAEQPVSQRKDAATQLSELVAECCGNKPPTRVAAGIPTAAVLFASFRAPSTPASEMTTDSLLANELHGAAFDSKDLCADWMPVEIGKTPCVLFAAARSERVQAARKPFTNGSLSPQRYEPEAWAALRASWTYQRPLPRRGLEARFLIGPEGGLAILTCGTYPLTWRAMQWDPQRAQEIILGGVRALETYARQRLGLGPVQRIAIQGLSGAGAKDLTLDGVDTPIAWVDGPPYGGELIAFGLGLGALDVRGPALNLARSFQQASGIGDLFPKGEAALIASLIFCLAMILTFHMWDLQKTLARLKAHSSQVGWARSMNVTKLKQERTSLLTQTQPLAAFMTGRVLWTPYLIELPAILPDKIVLFRLQFGDAIWTKDERRELGDRFLLLRGRARVSEGGAVPQEVDATLRALQESPLVTKTFPIVRLATFAQRKEGRETEAAFDILCVPKAAGKSAAPQGAAKNEGKSATN